MQDSVQPGFCSEMQFDHAPTKAANQSFQLERFPQLLDLSVTLNPKTEVESWAAKGARPSGRFNIRKGVSVRRNRAGVSENGNIALGVFVKSGNAKSCGHARENLLDWGANETGANKRRGPG
jgi:hypothetical protein